MNVKDVYYCKARKTVFFIFILNDKTYEGYIRIDKKTFKKSFSLPNTVDFLIPYLGILALSQSKNIDLQTQKISSHAIRSFDIFQKKLTIWFPSLFSQRVEIKNYRVVDPLISSHGDRKGLFFSLGVDSFDSLIDITSGPNKNGLVLCNVMGLDVHQQDREIYGQIKKNIILTSKHYNTDVLLISTNLREIMEKYIPWTYGHGAVLHATALLFSTFFKKIYIPSTVHNEQLTPHGSHPDIDEIWSTDTEKIIHHGLNRRRIDKVVKNISRDDFSIQHLNVCYKNIGNTINCGVCNKCIITKLEFYIAGILDKSNFINKKLSPEMIKKSVHITTDVEYIFAQELLPLLSKNTLEKKIKKKLRYKLKQYNDNQRVHLLISPPQKNKNILFIDFNGVISYNKFWSSIENKENNLFPYFKKIENYLFKDNTQIVKDWMVGKYTCERVHQILSKSLDLDYEMIFNLFVEDCKNLDISYDILSKLNELQTAYRCILITDNMDSFDRFTLPNNPKLIQSFDKIYNSFSHKRLKGDKDGLWFKEIIQKYNAETGNCILIDDSKGNCRVFEELGGQSYRTKTEMDVIGVLNNLSHKVRSKWEWQY